MNKTASRIGSDKSSADKYPFLFDVSLPLVVTVSAIVLLVNLGVAKAFYADDEYLYAKIAAEMLRRHDLWVPTWLGQPAFYKPPLTYWLMMVGYKVGGVNLLAARVPIALTGVLSCVFVYLLGLRLYGRREAVAAGLLTATSFGFLAYGRVCMMDMPLTLALTAAIYSLYRAVKDGSGFHASAFFTIVGISSLIKGPISILIILLIAVLFLLFFGGWKRLINRFAVPGMLLGIIATGIWPFMLLQRGFLSQWYSFFVLRENLGKFSDGAHYSAMSILPYVFQHLFPWSVLFLFSLPLIFHRRNLVRIEFGFPIIWLLTIIGVFLIPETKLKWYVVPTLPATALLTSGMWYRNREHWLFRLGSWITAAIIAIMAVGVLAGLKVSAGLGQHMVLVISLAGLLIAMYFVIKRELAKTALGMFVAIVTVILALPWFTFDALPARVIPLMGTAQAPVGVVRKQVYYYSYELNRPVTQLYTTKHVVKMFNRDGRVIVADSDLRKLTRDSGSTFPAFEKAAIWSQWKESVTAAQIIDAIRKSDLKLLQEPVYLITATGRVSRKCMTPFTGIVNPRRRQRSTKWPTIPGVGFLKQRKPDGSKQKGVPAEKPRLLSWVRFGCRPNKVGISESYIRP
jgi:4-amino-4-deoxy-L-arabinose transferase-like glycosyltransferase